MRSERRRPGCVCCSTGTPSAEAHKAGHVSYYSEYSFGDETWKGIGQKLGATGLLLAKTGIAAFGTACNRL